MRQTLASSDLDFWRTTFLFHPGGVDLVQHTHTALNAWIGATVLGGVSEITALNVVLLGALTLAGFGTYLLAWDITGHRGASIVAGVFFCSAPFFPARLLGHFNFVSAWGLPFFAWLWLRAFACAVATSSPRTRSAARGDRGGWRARGGRVHRLLLPGLPAAVHGLRARAAPGADLLGASGRADRLDWIDTALVALLAIAIVAARRDRDDGRVHAARGGRAHLDAQRPERQDRRVGAGARRRLAARQVAAARRARRSLADRWRRRRTEVSRATWRSTGVHAAGLRRWRSSPLIEQSLEIWNARRLRRARQALAQRADRHRSAGGAVRQSVPSALRRRLARALRRRRHRSPGAGRVVRRRAARHPDRLAPPLARARRASTSATGRGSGSPSPPSSACGRWGRISASRGRTPACGCRRASCNTCRFCRTRACRAARW